MGVYINGMAMPRSCRQCSLYLQSMDSERNVYENCAVTAKSYNWGLTTRPSDCPLVPVPEHGRLIDADAMIEKYNALPHRYDRSMVGMISNCDLFDALVYDLQKEPTIIPAEEGET